MGIGIIALGLWLLLGISFSINSIELFPDALSMMVIMVGIVIVFRRAKSRELLISLGLLDSQFCNGTVSIVFFQPVDLVTSIGICLYRELIYSC